MSGTPDKTSANATDVRPADVGAVFVTYRGGPLIERTIGAVVPQVAHVFVVDNGSTDEATIEALRRLESSHRERLTVVRLGENLGIGAALNEGLARARSAGLAWLLTMDQDSVAAPDMVAQLRAAVLRCADPGSVALVAPRCVDLPEDNEPVAAQGPVPEPGTLTPLRWIHTSGNLVRISAFDRVGPFRADYFIDHVDYEFCLRLRRAGLAIVRCEDAVLQHRLGYRTRARFFHRMVTCYNYSPARRYYQTRNGIVLALDARDWEFTRSRIKVIARETLVIALFEKDRVAKLRLTARGIRDGFAGKTGPL